MVVALQHGVVGGRWRTRIGQEEARALEEDGGAHGATLVLVVN